MSVVGSLNGVSKLFEGVFDLVLGSVGAVEAFLGLLAVLVDGIEGLGEVDHATHLDGGVLVHTHDGNLDILTLLSESWSAGLINLPFLEGLEVLGGSGRDGTKKDGLSKFHDKYF